MAIITKSVVGNVTGATANDDVILINDPTKLLLTDLINGQGGDDEIRFTSITNGQTLTLGPNNLTNVEYLTLSTDTSASLAGTGAGSANLNLTLTAVTNSLTSTVNSLSNLTITGNDGNNNISVGVNDFSFIDGGSGIDTLTYTKAALSTGAAAGQNTLNVNDLNALAIENVVLAGAIALNVDASGYSGNNLNITGNGGNNTILGGSAGDAINALAGNDAVIGGIGNDVITGGAGIDSLDGGDGSDVFIIGSTLDYVTAATAAASDQIDGNALGTTADAILGEVNSIYFTSTVAAQTLTVNQFTHDIQEILVSDANGVTTGTTALNVDATAYVDNGLYIEGNNAVNIITGTREDDFLFGNAGNDIFIVKSGADHGTGEMIAGGLGTDEIRFTSVTDGDTLFVSPYIDVETVKISDAAGSGLGVKALNIDASAVSSPELMDAGNPLNLVGNAGNNVITGSDLMGNIITGGAGADQLYGGSFDDTFVIGLSTEYTATEEIHGGDGVDTINIRGAGTVILNTGKVSGIEKITLAPAAGALSAVNGVNASAVVSDGLQIEGNSVANTVIGTNGDDVITGGAGADVLNGGNGDDGFLVGSGADATGDTITGGNGYDTLVFQNTNAVAASLTLTLGASTTGLEEVLIGIADLETGEVDSTGTTNNNVNAAALTAAASLSILGNFGNNVITGGAGNDIIEGSYGVDTLNGGLGNDTFVVRRTIDYRDVVADNIDGGVGIDTLSFTDVGPAQLVLDAGLKNVEVVQIGTLNAWIDTAGPDNIPGNGDDVDEYIGPSLGVNASALTYGVKIVGNMGANTILGSSFADTIESGAGDDIIKVSAGAHHGSTEKIDGGNGNDTLYFTSSTKNDTLFLNANDRNIELVKLNLTAAEGVNNTATRVNASGYTGNLGVDGNGGNNVITMGGGDDTVNAGSGNDTVSGANGADVLNGEAGNDYLVGGNGGDTINGGEGVDVLIGGKGSDVLLGGTENDVFIYYSAAEFEADEVVDGGFGGEGFDQNLNYFGDSIYFAGRINNDTLTLNADVTNVESVYIGTPSLVGPILSGNKALNLDASDVTTALMIQGNEGANVIRGTDDVLHGGPNGIDDYIDGNGGADTIYGGNGIDVLTGGAGADQFRFDTALDATDNVDTIMDFTHGSDMIVLDKAIFGALAGTAGNTLEAGDFGTLITLTGNNLYYDADGAGGNAGVQFATLDTGAGSVTNSDFLLG